VVVFAVVGIATSHWPELVRRIAILSLRQSLRGEISLGDITFTRGRILLTDFRLALPDDPHPLVDAPRVEVRYDPQRLFCWPLRPLGSIRQMSLDAPSVYIARDADGQWNMMRAVKPQPPRKPSRDQFRGEIVVRDGEVRYTDAIGLGEERGPITEHLIGLHLQTSRADAGFLPFRLSASSALQHARMLHLSGGVNLDALRVQCEMRYHKLDLAYLRRFIPDNIPVTVESGYADGRLHIVASPDLAQGTVAIEHSVLADLQALRGVVELPEHPVPYAITAGQLRLVNGTVELAGVEGEVGGIPLKAEGVIQVGAIPVYALQVHTAGADASKFTDVVPGFAHLPMRLHGRTSVEATITGAVPSLHVDGQVSGLSFSADFGEFSQIAGDFRYHDGMVAFPKFRAQAMGGQLSGHGWLALDHEVQTRIMLHADTRDIGVQHLVQQFAPAADVGQASPLASLSGVVNGPVTLTVQRDGAVALITRCTGTVHGGELFPASVEMDAAVRINVKNAQSHIRVERCTGVTDAGAFRVSGAITGEVLDLTAEGSRVDLAAVTSAYGQPGWSGTGYVQGKITGTFTAPIFTGTVQAQHGQFRTYPYSELAADVKLALATPAELTLRNLRLTSGESQLTGEAQWHGADNPDGDWKLSGAFALPTTSIAAIQETLGVSLPLEGIIEQGWVAFSDLPDAATGTGKLVLRHPALHLGDARVIFDRASIDLEFHGDVITIPRAELVYREGGNGKGAHVAQPPIVFVAHGQLSLDPAVPPEQQLSLTIAAEHLDLDSVTTLTDDLAQAGTLTNDGLVRLPVDLAGKLSIAAKVTGQLYDPVAGEWRPDRLLPTLQIHGTVDAGTSLMLADLGFQRAHMAFTFHGARHALQVREFALERQAGAGDYAVYLAKPGTIYLDQHEIDMTFALKRIGTEGGMNLLHLRRDLLALTRAVPEQPWANALMHGVGSVPLPFAGRGDLQLALAGLLQRPLISMRFAFSEMMVGGDEIPNIEGEMAYDTAPALLNVERLVAKGFKRLTADVQGHTVRTEIDPYAMAEVQGTISMPQRNDTGQTVVPGDLNLTLNVQSFDPSLLAAWFNVPIFRQLGGKATVWADITGTTAAPAIMASLDVEKPTAKGVEFDSLSAIVMLANDRLRIGRGEFGVDNGAATLHFKRAATAADGTEQPLRTQPLEIIADLPFAWVGPGQPAIPQDQPLSISLKLPEQGMDVVRGYLPSFPASVDAAALQAERLEGMVSIGGTLDHLELASGLFRLQAPELALPVTDEDLPNRLRDMAIDIAFYQESTSDGPVNVMQVNDLSVVYDRVVDRQPKKQDFFVVRWIKQLFGREEPERVFSPGAIMVQGDVRTDPQLPLQLDIDALSSETGLAALAELPNRLQYNLYAKMVRTPLQWRDAFQGMVSMYLHMGNRREAPYRPLLTGMVYVEQGRLRMMQEQGAQGGFIPIPVDADLSIAVQTGPGNHFEVKPSSGLLSSTLSANLPFTPSNWLAPFSQTERIAMQYHRGEKPRIEPSDPVYFTTSTFAKSLDGTNGWVEGRLSRPVIEGNFVLKSRQARVTLPGGDLLIEDGRGSIHVAPLDPDDKPALYANVTASGVIDQVQVKATVSDAVNLLNINYTDGKLPIAFTAESAPPGVPLPSENEIYSRLIGAADVIALLKNESQGFTPLAYRYGQKVLFQNTLDRIAQSTGLGNLSVNMDPTRALEATMITSEIGTPDAGYLSLGHSRIFSDPPEWKIWLGYRLPDYRLMRNLSVVTTLDESENLGINLQYNFGF
jgi:hypothetical protein